MDRGDKTVDFKRYYQALIEKDPAFEGTFFVGVKTTGVFCHSTCPARKPKFENCDFFQTAKEALLAGFRPCKRCNPLSNPSKMSPAVRALVDAVESEPEKKWANRDFEALSTSAASARRQFQKKFGMTFVEYARSRRLGMALKEIKEGGTIINAQLSAGFESDSGFRDALKHILGKPASKKLDVRELCATWIDTPIGAMIAIADEVQLYLLEFVDRRGLEKEMERLKHRLNAVVIPRSNQILTSMEQELSAYFHHGLTDFQTPIAYFGSAFQMKVWDALRRIPVGTTVSYHDLACAIGNPQAVRAVGRANGVNQLSIIVPCHRVINKNGDLGDMPAALKERNGCLAMKGVFNRARSEKLAKRAPQAKQVGRSPEKHRRIIAVSGGGGSA